APISHAGAETDSAARQGLLGIAEVFVDTIVLCTVTGLVLLLAGVCGSDAGGDYTAVVLDAFSVWFGEAAAVFLTVSIVFYAFATLVCWSFYGTESVRALFSDRGSAAVRRGVTLYLALYAIAAACGALVPQPLLWELSDLLTMAMTALNTTGVLMLMGNVKVPDIRRRKNRGYPIDSAQQL
ncbi:MAG: sodium:alanine symporter family protein, partial [Clostridia bacterium]|nr:sodium:alanine symporter family protein [Clostridia bacterium]